MKIENYTLLTSMTMLQEIYFIMHIKKTLSSEI